MSIRLIYGNAFEKPTSRGVSTLFGRKNVLFLEIFFGERI